MVRSSSGSSFSASGVDPERSANRIVTTFRCSRRASADSVVTCSEALVGVADGTGACAAAIGVPQEGQNRSFARIAAPQFAQVAFVLVARSGIGVQGTSARRSVVTDPTAGCRASTQAAWRPAGGDTDATGSVEPEARAAVQAHQGRREGAR